MSWVIIHLLCTDKVHLWMCRSWKMLVIPHQCADLHLWGIWVGLFLLEATEAKSTENEPHWWQTHKRARNNIPKMVPLFKKTHLLHRLFIYGILSSSSSSSGVSKVSQRIRRVWKGLRSGGVCKRTLPRGPRQVGGKPTQTCARHRAQTSRLDSRGAEEEGGRYGRNGGYSEGFPAVM